MDLLFAEALALPVAPHDAVPRLRSLADELVVLRTPREIDGVGRWYYDFRQTTDPEVKRALGVTT